MPFDRVVSIAFLCVCIAGAAFTANAFRPVKGGRVLLIPSFLQSWFTNELALHQFVAQLIATGVFVWLGALHHWPGWVGLGLTSISWGAMIVLWRQGRRAEDLVEAALDRVHVDRDLPRVPAMKLLFPFSMHRPGIRVTRGVEYGRVGKKRLLLDVFEPREKERNRPAIVHIHGGGWVMGSRREQGLPLLSHLAVQGWVGFNVDYRLSPGATWPDHLVDVKRAIAWIRRHAADYGIDPEFLVVTGGSAGGHLAAMTALTAGDPRYQPGFEDADTSVQGAVPFYAIYCFTDRLKLYGREFFKVLVEPLVMKARLADAPDRFEDASPLDQIHDGAPPFLVVHGDRDTLAPVEYARLFVEKLRAASISPVYYAELAGAQHAFDVFHSPRASRVVEGVTRFAWTLFEAHVAARRATGSASLEESVGPVGESADLSSA